MKHTPVIYYHSIGPRNRAWKNNFLTLDLHYFENQLKYLSKHYNTISLDDYWKIRNGIKNPLKTPLILTFDDGYLDNWQYAYPILKKYGMHGTIFISPEFVDRRKIVRPNLEDLWKGKAVEQDLNHWGFLSWEEMRIMLDSGIMDIQSHTMSHTKYPVSEKIIDFHRPGADCLYYISNHFPEKKPYYIEDKGFEKLLPFGYPVFEMRSSVVARKVQINPRFIDYCIDKLKDYDFKRYKFENAYDLIHEKHREHLEDNTLIISTESDNDYENRIRYEINESRHLIEEKLGKQVNYLCWPHGDNNENLHQIAIDSGYLMTTIGKAKDTVIMENNRIPERMGLDFSNWYKKQKSIFKLKALSGKLLHRELLNYYRQLIH